MSVNGFFGIRELPVAPNVVEVIAPFGGAEEMVRDLKAKVFPDRELKYVALGQRAGRWK